MLFQVATDLFRTEILLNQFCFVGFKFGSELSVCVAGRATLSTIRYLQRPFIGIDFCLRILVTFNFSTN